MHPELADAIVESVRRRERQGDCPTEPAHSVETLEDCVLTLAQRLTAPLPSPPPSSAPELRVSVALASDLSKVAQRVAARALRVGDDRESLAVLANVQAFLCGKRDAPVYNVRDMLLNDPMCAAIAHHVRASTGTPDPDLSRWQAGKRPCDCHACSKSEGEYVATCCPRGLTHGAFCNCGSTSLDHFPGTPAPTETPRPTPATAGTPDELPYPVMLAFDDFKAALEVYRRGEGSYPSSRGIVRAMKAAGLLDAIQTERRTPEPVPGEIEQRIAEIDEMLAGMRDLVQRHGVEAIDHSARDLLMRQSQWLIAELRSARGQIRDETTATKERDRDGLLWSFARRCIEAGYDAAESHARLLKQFGYEERSADLDRRARILVNDPRAARLYDLAVSRSSSSVASPAASPSDETPEATLWRGAIANAIEETVTVCTSQELHREPMEARAIDYAGIVRRAVAKSFAVSLDPEDTK